RCCAPAESAARTPRASAGPRAPSYRRARGRQDRVRRPRIAGPAVPAPPPPARYPAAEKSSTKTAPPLAGRAEGPPPGRGGGPGAGGLPRAGKHDDPAAVRAELSRECETFGVEARRRHDGGIGWLYLGGLEPGAAQERYAMPAGFQHARQSGAKSGLFD